VTIELTVLGSAGAWPGPGQAASGYLVRAEGYALVLDFGTGALSNLQRHLPHERIDAIVLSHEHLDHCLDLYPLFYARYFHPEPLPPLPVVTPPGVFARINRLEDEDGIRDMAASFEFRELEPGAATELGPFRLRTRLLPHWVANLGMRLEADGAVLAYTGDTGPSEDIEAIARDADLLLTEASWQDSGEERQPFHLTARQAGTHAARAGTGRLVLSHFWPGNDRDVSREQAAEEFEGEIVLADEGLTMEIG
jgi:ribonuclease BN (tRNA processing enzyme)